MKREGKLSRPWSCGVDGLGWEASVAQGAVQDSAMSAFLESDGGIAGVCQQPVHLGLEPALKDLSRSVGSVGQIRVGRIGRTTFAVDLEWEVCGCLRVYDCDIEVEEVHVPTLVKFGWVDSVLRQWRALPF